MGLDVRIQSVPNPRREAEEHFYQPVHTALLELGLAPTYMTDEVLAEMLEVVMRYRDSIKEDRILPRVAWS
jgi:UDP-sulfoquinovose synthase